MLRRVVGSTFFASFVAFAVALTACGSATAPPAQPAKPASVATVPTSPPATAPAAPAAAAPPATSPAGQPASAGAGPVVELRAGTSTPQGDVLANAADKFAELVKEKSKGQVLVRVNYTSLGVEQQLTQSVMSGSVDIGMISNGNAGRFTDAWLIYDLPFLFKNYEQGYKSLDGPIGRKAVAQFEKDLGVKMLFVMSYGAGRDVQFRNKFVKTPADMKGLKIRVVSTPVDLATLKAWGANPTPIDWSQTLSALQMGVVDGATGNTNVIRTTKEAEVIKYGVHIDYQLQLQPFFINGQKFASLTPQQQQILLDAAKEAKAWNNEQAAQLIGKEIQALKEMGVTIYTPTADEYTQWASVREPVWNEVADQLKGKLDLAAAKQLYESQ